MKARELKQLLELAERLTPSQRDKVLAQLHSARAVDQVAAAIEQRMADEPLCPHCAGRRVVRNGQAGGLQRYKCAGCARSFNALTGTPLARLRHRERWLQQAQALDEGFSVRKAARFMGVHRTTAFRWRHRFLATPREIKPLALGGIAEADETYVLRSYKGQRRMLRSQASRPARRRGGRAAKRGLSTEQVPVLVVRNRAGQTTDFVLPAPTKRWTVQVLGPALARDVALCTDGSGTLAAVAEELRVEHHAVNLLRGERTRGAWHIQNVNAYHGRFKTWMLRFKGVATSYLPNYLGWFRALDRNAQSGARFPALLTLAIAA
jgi:transposase-like protein